MDKTDLSLLLSALGLAVSVGFGRIAAALLVSFPLGLLLGQHRRRGP